MYTQNIFWTIPHKYKMLQRQGRGRDMIFQHKTAWLEQGACEQEAQSLCFPQLALTGKELGATPQVHSYMEVMWKLTLLPRKGLQTSCSKTQGSALRLLLNNRYSESTSLFFSFTGKICDQWGCKWNEAKTFIERFDWCHQNGTNTEIKLFAKASSFDRWHLGDTA